MLRPYPPTTCGDRPRQSIPGVLRDQRIGVDLRLRNRHQDAEVRRRPRLELPGLRVLAVADQVLASLALAVEFEQPLAQNHVSRDRAEGVRLRYRTEADGLQQGQGRRAARCPLELRLGLDQVHLTKPEPRKIVTVVLLHVPRIDGPLVDARSFTGWRFSRLTCGPTRNMRRRLSAGSKALYVCARVAKPFQGEGLNWL